MDCGEPRDGAPRQGRYANYFEVGANRDEVVIDLGQAYGRDDEPSLHTRIVTAPVHARELIRLLQEALGHAGA